MADEQQTLDQQTPEQPTGAAEDLTARVQELEEQLAAAQDQALRMVADLQNVRRRAEQDSRRRTSSRWRNSPATCWRWSTPSSAAWRCPIPTTRRSSRCAKGWN